MSDFPLTIYEEAINARADQLRPLLRKWHISEIKGPHHNGNWDGDHYIYMPEAFGNELPNCHLISRQGGSFSKPIGGTETFILSKWGRFSLIIGDAGSKTIIEENVNFSGSLSLWGGGTIWIGSGTSIYGARIIAEHCDISIGPDCLGSDEIVIQGNDQHAIIDLETGDWLNGHRRHIVLKKHVWLGRRCTLLSDITIGEGSVIGACALVAKSIPHTSVAAGVPARVIKSNISWLRSFKPSGSAQEIALIENLKKIAGVGSDD